MGKYSIRDQKMNTLPGNQTDLAAIWIKGCTEWIYKLVLTDWKLYYVNIMFEPLRGPPSAIIPKMRRGIYKFYGRFCTEFVHDGRAKSEKKRMPRFWLFPDLPVRKNEKNSLREVTINGGLHYNGPMLLPPISRFQECPIKHLEENQAKYARHGIKRIHIEPGGDISGLADYAAKTIKNRRAADHVVKTIKYRRANEDDIIVLPRTVGELPEKKKPIFDPKDRLLKDIQSSMNVSDEMAQQIRDDAIKEAWF